MATQYNITLPPFPRGFHLITHYVQEALADLPQTGMLHVFILHTSAGLAVNENADPSVLTDFSSYFNRLVKENESWYTHNEEGPDDMPAHIKSVICGSSVTIPITNGRMNLGTWQGIYLCEFRNRGGARRLVATVIS